MLRDISNGSITILWNYFIVLQKGKPSAKLRGALQISRARMTEQSYTVITGYYVKFNANLAFPTM